MSIVRTKRKYPEHPKRIEEKTGQVFFVVSNVNSPYEEKYPEHPKKIEEENRTGLLCNSHFKGTDRPDQIGPRVVPWDRPRLGHSSL
jgi:hypothetical protein